MKEEIRKEVRAIISSLIAIFIALVVITANMQYQNDKDHAEIKQLLIERIQADSLEAVKNIEL